MNILIYNTFTHYLTTLISLILSILIARHLGPEGRGIYFEITFYVLFFVELISFGSFKALVYVSSKYNKQSDSFLKIFYKFFIPISLLAWLIFCIWAFYFVDKKILIFLLIFSFYIPTYYLFHVSSHMLHGIGKYLILNNIRIFQLCIWCVLILIFIYGLEDLNFKTITIIHLFTHIFASLLFFIFYQRNKIRAKSKEKKNKFKYFINTCFKNYKLNISYYIYSNIDLFFVLYLFDHKKLGLYVVAKNLSNLAIPLFSSFSERVLQEFSKISDIKKIIKYSFILTLISILGYAVFFLFGQIVINLALGEAFKEVYNLTLIILVGSIFQGFILLLNEYSRSKNFRVNLNLLYLFFIFLFIISITIFGNNTQYIAYCFTLNTILLFLGLLSLYAKK